MYSLCIWVWIPPQISRIILYLWTSFVLSHQCSILCTILWSLSMKSTYLQCTIGRSYPFIGLYHMFTFLVSNCVPGSFHELYLKSSSCPFMTFLSLCPWPWCILLRLLCSYLSLPGHLNLAWIWTFLGIWMLPIFCMCASLRPACTLPSGHASSTWSCSIPGNI